MSNTGMAASTVAALVFYRIDGDSEPVQSLHGARPDTAAVLPDPAGEHDGVESAHGRCIRADVELHAVAEDFDCHDRPGLARLGCGEDLAHVGTDAGETQEPAFPVQQIVDLLKRVAFIVDKVADDAGIEVAHARAHDEPRHRAETHAGVDGAAALNGAGAASVAEVAGDDVEPVQRRFQEFGGLPATYSCELPWKPNLRMPF